MKIFYPENPLAAKLILDSSNELDKIKKVIKKNTIEYYKDEPDFSKEEIEDESDFAFKTFKNVFIDSDQTHSGDCTNVPSSCVKCYCLDALKIDDVPGMKHDIMVDLYWVGFGRIEKSVNRYVSQPSIEIAIERLQEPAKHWSNDTFAESLLNDKRKKTLEFLFNYRDTLMGKTITIDLDK